MTVSYLVGQVMTPVMLWAIRLIQSWPLKGLFYLNSMHGATSLPSKPWQNTHLKKSTERYQLSRNGVYNWRTIHGARGQTQCQFSGNRKLKLVAYFWYCGVASVSFSRIQNISSMYFQLAETTRCRRQIACGKTMHTAKNIPSFFLNTKW